MCHLWISLTNNPTTPQKDQKVVCIHRYLGNSCWTQSHPLMALRDTAAIAAVGLFHLLGGKTFPKNEARVKNGRNKQQ